MFSVVSIFIESFARLALTQIFLHFQPNAKPFFAATHTKKKLANRYFAVTKMLSRNAFCNWVFKHCIAFELTTPL